MNSKAKARWHKIAAQAAARTFEKHNQPTILIRRVSDVACVMASVPAEQAAVIHWLRDKLRLAKIRELAYASHPATASERQAHAVVLHTTGEEPRLVEAMVANARLKLAI